MAYSGFAKWIVVVVAITGSIMELIDTSIVNVALNQMSGSLGASIEDIAWVITAYGIANVVVIPLTGFLSRYFGRKNYYITSIIIFTVASWACGNSTSLGELIFFRFLQGIGGGALLSTSQALLFDAFSIQQRPIASALFGMGIVMGPTFGPTLGGLIIDHYNWPLIFTINIPIGILAAFLAFTFIEKKPEEYNINRKEIHIDWTGIILLIIGVGSLQYVLERGEGEDWFASRTIRYLSVSALVGVASFIWWSLRTKYPAVNLKVMKNSTLSLSTVMTFVSGLGLFSSVLIFPLLAQRVIGFTPTMTGIALIPGSLVALPMFALIGRMMQSGRVQPRTFVIIGYVFFVFFCFAMAQSGPDMSMGDFTFKLIMRGVGISMLTVPLINSAVATLKPQDLPAGIAITNMIRQLGGAFGIAIVNTFIANKYAGHHNDLAANVNEYNNNYLERVNGMAQSLVARGVNTFSATQDALQAIERQVSKQAYLLSYLDAFRMVGFFFIITFPLLFFIKSTRVSEAAAKAASEAH